MLCLGLTAPEGSRDSIGKFEAAMEDVSQADLEAFFAGTIELFLSSRVT